MDSYDLDYALARLREAIDYAEMDDDFQPARKWVNEVEKSAQQSMHPTSETLPVLQALSTPKQRTVCAGCEIEITESDVYCSHCGLWNPNNRR